jgi:hypothetical protein
MQGRWDNGEITLFQDNASRPALGGLHQLSRNQKHVPRPRVPCFLTRIQTTDIEHVGRFLFCSRGINETNPAWNWRGVFRLWLGHVIYLGIR